MERDSDSDSGGWEDEFVFEEDPAATDTDEDEDGFQMTAFSDAERQQLAPFTELHVLWGYRTGPHWDHERFELDTHTQGLRFLQDYTDIVFRTLQELHVQQQPSSILRNDICQKTRLLFLLDASYLNHAANRALLQRFARSSPRVPELMRGLSELAETETEAETENSAFRVLVGVARLLYEIMSGRRQQLPSGVPLMRYLQLKYPPRC